ncbi:MAG: ArsA family ATPase [Bacteroidia bacterium]|nr:ArsA family ATPase [Bacteroidia bacterium]
MRILLFTGKGGVGKTTIAAATGIKAASQGVKTLVISTDPAHSLSDALDVKLGPEPTEVSENFWAQELDVYYSMKKYWGNMRQLMLALFRWQGVQNVMAEEMSALPGMEEASAFLWIEKYFSEGQYDLIIIDSAPTGETLTLLTLPQVTKWWVTKAFPFQKFAIKTVGSMMRKTTGIPVDKGYEELETMFSKLERVQAIFSDPKVASIRLVVNPERMVIKEAKRAYTYLQLYGYHVDALVINRIIPDFDGNGVFSKYLASQKEYLNDIEESFSPLPILKVGHLGQEVFGMQLLEGIGDSVYGERSPMEVFHSENPFMVEEIEGGYAICFKLSFITKDDFTLNVYGDELVLNIGNQRKNIFLPRFVNFLKMDSYSFEEPWLTVKFMEEPLGN